MSTVVRARLSTTIFNRGKNRCFSVYSDSTGEAIGVSSSAYNHRAPPPPNVPSQPSGKPGAETKLWNFLKYGLVTALTGGVGAKFKALVHSATVSAPANLLELYIDLRRSTEEHIRGFTEPSSDNLLPDLPAEVKVFTLVLDLSETLIYSDWKRERGWRTFKRPGVDAFLEHLSQFYEIVLYTDQLPVYVESVVERLDPKHCITYRLSRAATKYKDQKHYTVHVKHAVKCCQNLLSVNFYNLNPSAPANLLELYIDLRRSTEEHIRGFTEPSSDNLLPDLPAEVKVFTLVLDLSETLIYSDWKRERGWRTFKRPGVDAFLEHLSQFYEIVLYTDQLPVDLSMLDRDPSRILYLSGNALETSLHPENCIPIKPWTGEIEDTALLDYIPFLEFVATRKPADIREVLASFQDRDIPKEFIERSKEYQKKMQEQK